MNENTPSGSSFAESWPTRRPPVRVPDTSMLPDSEQTPHAATGSIYPPPLHGRASATEDALHARSGALHDTRDAWADGLRTTVRRKPLACVAAALALGAVIARITR